MRKWELDTEYLFIIMLNFIQIFSWGGGWVVKAELAELLDWLSGYQ